MNVFVALQLPFHDGSGNAKILGAYSLVEKAEARCWRELQVEDGQPTKVIECIINEDRKEET